MSDEVHKRLNATSEDKRRIMARLFFADNRDQYEDFHEAFTEFCNQEVIPDKFVDKAIGMFLDPIKPGHSILMNDVGHVAEVHEESGLFNPLTEMSQEEGEEFEEKYVEARDANPDLDGEKLLALVGWRVIVPLEDDRNG